jgi:hypothetical protein
MRLVAWREPTEPCFRAGELSCEEEIGTVFGAEPVVGAAVGALHLDQAAWASGFHCYEVGVAEASGGSADPPVVLFEDGSDGAFSGNATGHAWPLPLQ